MTKKIAVLATNLVEDIELTSPKETLEKDGNEVILISFEAQQEFTGKKGTKFISDKGIDEVQPEEFDALLIPGGFSPDQLRSDPRFVSFVAYFLSNHFSRFVMDHNYLSRRV